VKKDYYIHIFHSDEDRGCIADIPDLRYCSAFGTTPGEALAEVLRAKKAWLQAARAAKKPVPKPSFRPDHQPSAVAAEGPRLRGDKKCATLLSGTRKGETQLFLDPLAVSIFDEEHAEAAERWATLGQDSRGRLLVVVHTFSEVSAQDSRVRIDGQVAEGREHSLVSHPLPDARWDCP